MHTQSELPCSLSQWWCICSHGACVHMLERTGRLTSTLLRVLSQQLLLRVQGWEVRGHYLLCAFAFISMDNLHSHMSLRHGDGPTREGRRRMVLLVKPATFLPRSKRIQEHSITHRHTQQWQYTSTFSWKIGLWNDGARGQRDVGFVFFQGEVTKVDSKGLREFNLGKTQQKLECVYVGLFCVCVSSKTYSIETKNCIMFEKTVEIAVLSLIKDRYL